MVHVGGPVGLDAVAVSFDDERAVADAGIVLCATLARRLGIEALVDETVDLGERPGRGEPGREGHDLVSAMALGADCIDDCDVLRAGRTGDVLGHRSRRRRRWGRSCGRSRSGMSASSTGCWPTRSRAHGRPAPARATGAWWSTSTRSSARSSAPRSRGPPSATPACVGYHPLIATRADTGEVLHIRLSEGVGRTRRAGCCASQMSSSPASSAPARPAPSCCAPTRGSGQTRRSTGSSARAGSSRSAFACSPRPHGDRRDRRAGLDHAGRLPAHSIAQIAETQLGERRLVVRRVRTLDQPGRAAAVLGALPFVTNRTDALATVEAEHRQHAVVELAIRDLKDQALAHFPSGKFNANAAWTVIACLAHNLLRWTSVLGLPGQTVRAARTLRRRLLALPGRLTRTARRWTLHLPARWPWQHAFTEALEWIRALPALG